MVSGKGEYARLVKTQERLPVNKPEVVSTRAILNELMESYVLDQYDI